VNNPAPSRGEPPGKSTEDQNAKGNQGEQAPSISPTNKNNKWEKRENDAKGKRRLSHFPHEGDLISRRGNGQKKKASGVRGLGSCS